MQVPSLLFTNTKCLRELNLTERQTFIIFSACCIPRDIHPYTLRDGGGMN